MSNLRTPHKSPRYSDSHGRIVTQNSNLSALLREKSEGVVASSRNASVVNSPALDVVSSDVVLANTVTNPVVSNDTDKVQYVVVSKSRLSLNSAANTDRNSLPLKDIKQDFNTDTELPINDSRPSPVSQRAPEERTQSKNSVLEGEGSKRYSYHSLKSSRSESQSRVLDHPVDSQVEVYSKGEGSVAHKDLQADANALTDSGVGDGDNLKNLNDNYSVNSRSRSNAQSAQLKVAQEKQTRIESSSGSQSNLPDNPATGREPSLYSHQHTRLSLNSQHDRVSRNLEPVNVDSHDQSVPPLDFSRLSQHISPASSGPPSDSSSNNPPTLQDHLLQQVQDQNLHASDRSSFVNFSPHVNNNNTTSRTYEVDTPVVSTQHPNVKSSADNFRGAQETYRQGDSNQDTFRDRQQGPDTLEQHPSDLASDLNVPIQFDTQAQRGDINFEKPPSPPVQTTPPLAKEPATSLRGNSNIYAVSNPEVLRAQGITPPPESRFSARQYSNAQSRQSRQDVKFDNASIHRSESNKGYSSPVKDRVPTPYAQEDRNSPEEYRPTSPPNWEETRPKEQTQTRQSRNSSKVAGSKPNSRTGSSKQGLPPQHPPLDTKHNTPKPGSYRHSASTKREEAVKRVYVESPSFTKEEEDEYRFVNSRLDDIEAKDTFREMDSKHRGYGGDDTERTGVRDRDLDRGQRGGESDYDRRGREQDRYNDRNQYKDQERYNDDRNNDRNRDKYEDRNHDRNQDRYEDRNNLMNGNDRRDDRDNRQRYDDRNEKYPQDPYVKEDRYRRLHDERVENEREPHRDEEPDFRRSYNKQNTEVDEQDLRKEAEYQKELKRRLDKQNLKDSDRFVSPQRARERDSYNKENFVRDSLEYPEDKDTGRSYARDSVDYNNYNEQNRNWGDPPQNPYQENQGQGQYYQQQDQGYDQHNQQGGYNQQQRGYNGPPQDGYEQTQQGGYAPQQGEYAPGYDKQSSKPDFYDPEDVARMEIVNPRAPRYDYVEKNKNDYGLAPKKSYRTIVHKKKEEEEKLEHVFITPKVPSKNKTKKAKAQSAQPEHMGYQPPPQNQYPMGFKPSSAEEVWAKRSAQLSTKKSSAGPAKKTKDMPKWSINNQVKHAYKYEAPPSVPTSGQGYKPQQNMSYSNHQGPPQQQDPNSGYGTPTRHLQPLENKPAPPTSTELVPTAVNPESPFRRHMELKPISQEILTEDGQRISVDINLRLISPPPHSGLGSPTQQQQLALVPVQETQGQIPDDGNQQRALGVPYQMQDQYGNYDNGYSAGYQEDLPQYEEQPFTSYSDIEQRIREEEAALGNHGGSYSKRFGAGAQNIKDETSNSDMKSLEEGYANLYSKMKSKDPNEHPWYKIYNLNDYKKMQREVRLHRGTLGPDLDTEPFKEKMEKRHKQFEYARMVMEKNRQELGSKKPPQFPRSPPKQGEENIKRKAALDYAKNVPKPAVKARPNQYNSYEVSAQLTPAGGNTKNRGSPINKSSPQTPQTMDVIDIRTLEQRHLQERKTADKIRSNMDSVLSQKAH